MKKNFLEGGQIVNTHGIKGEVKIASWCDTPEILAGIHNYYIDGAAYAVQETRIHKGQVLALLAGVEDVNAAMKLKGKTVMLRREDLTLPPGGYFLADLIGVQVLDADSGETLGVLENVLFPSAQRIYVVQGEREIMIPAVEQFIVETNLEGGYIKVRLIEGM